ncbi:MAG: LptF/LptG family permease [Sphingobacteriaceae bacterium]|nr:LptF/LptG family permease [Sphingobacteriaceae bacterium]
MPPFFVTLFVSVFLFFLVTVVITYLDDFMGKGLKTSDLLILFFYAYVAWIPQCIPLAVLLGSIMSFGNLAENYELAAMKSSGLSLFKIIKPVFIFILFLALGTFLFNNFVMPVVQLKFQSLLWDIRQTKPTVSIKEGIFYNKIDDYSIRVGKKSKNKDTLKEIYIYDHSAHQGNIIQMYAREGKMSTLPDSSAIVLTLRDGNRYEEVQNHQVNQTKKTLSQLSFKQLQVNIELVDFKLKRSAEEQWKGNENMLNIWQIDSVADSTKRKISNKLLGVYRHVDDQFYFRTTGTIRVQEKSEKQFAKLNQFYDSLNAMQYAQCLDYALNITRTNTGYLEGTMVSLRGDEQDILRFLTEWHKRIVISFACVILFFIGAPLGAIIKKGGLGLPVVIAVFFFLAYFILSEAFTSLAYDGTLPPYVAIWTPLFIFMPISIFLTYKAAKDSALFDLGYYFAQINQFFKKKKTA